VRRNSPSWPDVDRAGVALRRAGPLRRDDRALPGPGQPPGLADVRVL